MRSIHGINDRPVHERLMELVIDCKGNMQQVHNRWAHRDSPQNGKYAVGALSPPNLSENDYRQAIDLLIESHNPNRLSYARSLCNDGLNEFPKSPEIYIAHSRLSLEEGNNDQAKRVLQDAKTLDVGQQFSWLTDALDLKIKTADNPHGRRRY